MTALRAGVPPEVFWDMTPRELEEYFEAYQEDLRRQDLRFGLIAAVLTNIHRKPGTAAVHASDFFRRAPRPEDFMSVQEAKAVGRVWAAAHNAGVQEGA